jgi:hypothetical protein
MPPLLESPKTFQSTSVPQEAMSKAEIEIPKIRDYIREAERVLKLRNRRAIDAFPSLAGGGKLAKLAMPTATLQILLRWLWLQWHAGTPQAKVAPHCVLVVERSLEAAEQAADDAMRPQHDVFALMAAVLSGEWALAEKVAGICIAANPGSKSDQFFEAWAGILKYRLLKKADDELKQLGVLRKSRGKGMFSEPTSAMAEAFCNRDYGALDREIAKAVQKCQVQAEKLGALRGNDFTLSQDSRVFLVNWPWPEAVFAKMAHLEKPGSIALDEFWMPAGFIGQN